MAKHKPRSLRTSSLGAAILAICALLLLGLVGASSATAAGPGKSVSPKNADVLGKCTLTVQSVNPSDGTVHIRLAAQAQPASVFGYVRNVYTQVSCSVFDTSGTPLTYFNPFANGPVLQTTSVTPVIPYRNSYVLCGQALVKLAGGNTSLTPPVCA